MSSADRMLSVLQLFSLERSEWTAEDAAAQLGFSLSTSYRYFLSLAKAGLISPVKGKRSGRYVLGPAAIQLDWLIRNTDPLTTQGKEPLRFLAGLLDRPAVLLLLRLYHGKVICITHESIGFPNFASAYERGRPMPLFRGAASKVILANMPHRAIGALLKGSEGQLPARVTLEQYRRELTAVRREGVSITIGEVDEGLTGIAAPIFDADGIVGSLGYALASKDLDSASISRFAELSKLAAGHVSQALMSDAGVAPSTGPQRNIAAVSPYLSSGG